MQKLVDDPNGRVAEIERFVRLIVVGGLDMLAGLWVVALSRPWAGPWLFGAALALVGAGGVTVGIWRPLEY